MNLSLEENLNKIILKDKKWAKMSLQLFIKRQHFRPVQFNSLPNDKILDMYVQIESICRQHKICDSKNGICFGKRRVENIVGKGENAGNQHFLLIPLFFKRLLSQGC